MNRGGVEQHAPTPRPVAPHEASTVPPTGASSSRADTALRIVSITLMVVVIVAAATGLLGVRSSTGRASADGFDVAVRHASVSRPGLASPFEIEVTLHGAVTSGTSVEIAFPGSYLAMFDENGVSPEPDRTWQDGEDITWEYEVPPGEDRLRVTFDGRIEPAVQALRRDAAVRVRVDDETAVVDITTWVLP